MNNSEFLRGLMKRADGSLQAWFDAEHVESGPTNGIDGETNGIADGITLPDGDGLDKLRWFINEYDPSYHRNGLQVLEVIAGMIERDYVSRETHSKAADIWQAASEEWEKRCKKLESERDEWKAKAEHYGDHVDRLMEAIRDLAQKQPRTFDPEAPYKNAELVGKYIDELKAKAEIAERAMNAAAGKWARADARSAERAAAVERLRNCLYTSDSDLMRAMLNWGHEPHTGDDSRFALIDLLTDEPMDVQRDSNGTCPDGNEICPNDDYTPETVVNTDDVDSNDGKLMSNPRQPDGMDSREKLEADVQKFAQVYYADHLLVYDKVIELLDRQSSITERDVRTYLNREDSELIQAEVDNLQGQIEHLREEIAKRDKGIERLKRQRDEARADFAARSGALAKCEREREEYRDACGQLLDLADQMRLVRLDGCGAALAGGEGEVVS